MPNLEVMNLMKSMKSRGYVRETFNWQYYYWYLTNEGIEYLREYLHLPAEIVPAWAVTKAGSRRRRGYNVDSSWTEVALSRWLVPHGRSAS